MSIIGSNALAGASGQAGAGPAPSDFQIDRSVRLNDDDSAYFSRTPSSASNRRTFTLSFWIKRAGLTSNTGHAIFYAGTAGTTQNRTAFLIGNASFSGSGNSLVFGQDTGGAWTTMRETTALFRDHSAWAHIVLAVDTTLATASDRIKIYVNGVLQTSFATSNDPSQNHEFFINNNGAHYIGRDVGGFVGYLDAYLADFHLIDGQALAATDFGEFDSNNVWQPKEYTGTYGSSAVSYGNNSQISIDSGNYYLNNQDGPNAFDGNSSTYIDCRLGSGSNNTTNIIFEPTNGIANVTKIRVNSNYADDYRINNGTWTSFSSGGSYTQIYNGSAFTLTKLEIRRTGNSGSDYGHRVTAYEINDSELIDISAGVNGFHLDFSDNSSNAALGTDSSGASNNWTVNNIIAQSSNTPTTPGSGYNDNTLGYYLNNNPPLFLTKEPDGTGRGDGVSHGASTGTTWSVNDVLQWAIDWTGGKIWFGRNNTWYSGDPAAGTNPSVSSVANQNLYLALHYDSSDFELQVPSSASYTLPSGFSYWGGATLGTWKVSGTNQGGCPDIFSTTIPTSGKIYIEAIIKGGTSTYANVGLMNVGETSVITDSLIDTPTNYTASSGNNGGNYCTMNPLAKGPNCTLSNGNLDTTTQADPAKCLSTIGMSSGKWYAEFTCTNNSPNPGLATLQTNLSSGFLGNDAYGWVYGANGKKYHNDPGASGATYGATYTTGDVIGVAFDADVGTLTFYKNGSSQGAAYTGLTSGPYFFATGGSYSSSVANFGQRPFAHTPPTNHLALVTSNLSDPTIADGSTAFDVKTWQGSGVNDARTISGYNFSPDFVWGKTRSAAYRHMLYDTVRGAGKDLRSDATQAEATNDQYGYLSAFTSDGFTTSPGSSDNDHWNHASKTYVAWAWDGGTSTVSNTDGSITSSVRANQTAGFSIMTLNFGSYSGTSTVGHGLNAAPHWWIMKDRDSADGWYVGHISLGAGKYLRLESTNAEGSSTTLWDNTLPSSSVIYNNGTSMTGAGDYLMLAWAPVEGYSKFGTYTGNGQHNNDLGPFIYTGFRPAFIMFKRTDSAGAWEMYDSTRSPYNPYKLALVANTTGAEYDVGAYPADMLSNGFKIRHNGGNVNASGGTYVYMAFAEHPLSLNGGLAR